MITLFCKSCKEEWTPKIQGYILDKPLVANEYCKTCGSIDFLFLDDK